MIKIIYPVREKIVSGNLLEYTGRRQRVSSRGWGVGGGDVGVGGVGGGGWGHILPKGGSISSIAAGGRGDYLLLFHRPFVNRLYLLR